MKAVVRIFISASVLLMFGTSCKKETIVKPAADYRLPFIGFYETTVHYNYSPFIIDPGWPPAVDTTYIDTVELRLVGENEIGFYKDNQEKWVFKITVSDNIATFTRCDESLYVGKINNDNIEYYIDNHIQFCGAGPMSYSSIRDVVGTKI